MLFFPPPTGDEKKKKKKKSNQSRVVSDVVPVPFRMSEQPERLKINLKLGATPNVNPDSLMR